MAVIGSCGGLADGVADRLAEAVAVALGADVPLDDADPLGPALVVVDGCAEAVVVALVETVGFTGGDD